MLESEIEKLLRNYLDYLEIEKNRSPKTRENYEHYLGEFLKFAKIKSPAQITDDLVREFRLTLARPSGSLACQLTEKRLYAEKNHAELLYHRNQEFFEIFGKAGY